VSRSLSRLQALALGSGVSAALVVGAFALLSVGGGQWPWNEVLRVRVGFKQLHGVEVGTRVRVLGKESGEVEGIDLPDLPTGDVMLRLRLDGRVRPLIRADASAQIVAIGMVGGQAIEITPGSDDAPPIADGAKLVSRPSTDLTDLLAKMDHSLQKISAGQGSLGKLLKEDEAYQELLHLVRQSRGTLASLKQDADAIKSMPIVRGYVHDPIKTLIRPDCECNRQWFPEASFFESGRATLHAEGKSRLDELAPWLQGQRIKGSEIVVACYADPAMEPELASNITQKQSETICHYLTATHAVHKLGWFARRKVTPLGCGALPSPRPEDHSLPSPRIEILVFIPQS
jgi:phospholipid/cholesterol/gamma-HCH transport system substrate-binding protein